MGGIDHDKVTKTLKDLPKKRKYTHFSDKYRLLVGKHASVLGNDSEIYIGF